MRRVHLNVREGESSNPSVRLLESAAPGKMWKQLSCGAVALAAAAKRAPTTVLGGRCPSSDAAAAG